MSLELKDNEFPTQTSAPQENPWAQYFGNPIYNHQLTADARQTFDRFDLPEFYKGKNLFLADRLEGFILQESDLLWTRKILPLVKTDQLSISYSTWTFSETLAGRVPHEGISRIITSRKSKTSGAMERRGLAFILEHGFMKTEEGRRQYMLNIKQIVQAVQITLNFDVLSALLTCKRYDIQWLKEHGYFRQHLPEIMKREISMFGIIQKDVNGFDVAIEEYKKMLGRYAVAPDALIMPSKLQMYIPMIPDEKTLYSNRGKLGVDQFEKGPIATFRNIKIYEAKAFDLGNGELPVNLMSSGEQIGQHNIMALDENLGAEDYRSEHRDIMIYDADVDNFVRVHYLDALKHTLRFGKDSDDDHKDFLEKNDDAQDHMDALLYKDSNSRSWKKATMIGHLHKDESKHVDFLGKSLLMKMIGSAKAQLSSKIVADFEAGCMFIDNYKRDFPGKGRQLQEIIALGKAGNESTPDALQFLGAWEKVYRFMEDSFPDSWLMTLDAGTAESPAEWVSQLKMNGEYLKTPRSWKMAAAYLAVFGDAEGDLLGYEDAVEPRRSGEAMPGVEDIAKAHEMNVAALKHSKAVDTKVYETAVGKYEAGSDMHKDLVSGVAHLIGQHHEKMEDPMFTSTYGLLSKLTGRPSNDSKVLQRMGLTALVEKAKKAKKALPVAMSPTGKTVIHKGSDSFIGSPLHTIMKHACASSDDESEGDSGSGAGLSLFSRKSKKKAAKISTHVDLDELVDINDDEITTKNMVDRLKGVDRMGDGLDRLFGYGILFTRINMKSMEALHANNVIVPFDILLSRPFMEFEMNHGILTKAGRDTGATYVGHSDFQLGDNVQSKLHYGNYTFYAKSLVTNAKNVVLLKNIFINNYIGGFNSRFFTPDEAKADKHDDVFLAPGRSSMLAMLIPCGSMNRRAILPSEPIDMRTALPYYGHVFGMEGLEDPAYDEEYFEPNSQASLNAMCYQGMQYNYDAATKRFSRIILGTGHLGKNIYPGVREVYQGSMKYMEKKNYNQMF